MRLKIIRLIISTLFLLVALWLGYVQLICGNSYYQQSRNNSIRVIPLDNRRGKILDRNGIVLADNRMSFDVAIIPQELEDDDELFIFLSKVTSVSLDRLRKIYQRRFLTPFIPVTVARDIGREKAIILEENKFRFPGLIVQTNFQRFYVFGEANAHVIGYVGKVNSSRMARMKDYGYNLQNVVGYGGVEEFYEDYLRGEDGGVQIEVNNRGKQVRVLGYKDSTQGRDVTLTIDSRIQQIATAVFAGRPGAFVMMDVDSGEVLSLVSSPTFNPNILVEGRPEVSKIFSNTSAPLLNRVTEGLYPPGSVFKIPVAIAALEQKKITSHTTFICAGSYTLGGRLFHCSHTHGDQDLIEAIAHSCNVYFFHVGQILGPDLINRYAKLFGLGQMTNIDLPRESKGLMPERPRQGGRWFGGDILNMVIGQGDILTTPLQMANLMMIVVRGGSMITPHVLKGIEGRESNGSDHSPTLAMGKDTLRIIELGLEKSVRDEGGTARNLDIPGLVIYGKTGTAQSTIGKPHHAWFVGFCPETKKKVVFSVLLEYGGSSYQACELTKNIFLKLKEQDIVK